MSSICGFSFGKDLVRLDFPVVESVRSVLPVCDDFVFVVGKCDDGTRERVASIDPRVKVVDSEWPDLKVNGRVLAIEANKAMSAATASGCRWGLYIQADEVVHEDDLPVIEASCRRWAPELEVKALLFRYLHFVLDYRSTDPWAYHRASRVVRLDDSCEIIGDACGPALRKYSGPQRSRYLDKHHLGTAVRSSGARIFHYGWVKSRAQLDAKFAAVGNYWWGTLSDEERKRHLNGKFGRFLERYPILKNYEGSHPAVMADRVAGHSPYGPARNRWTNWHFYAEVLRHGFHG